MSISHPDTMNDRSIRRPMNRRGWWLGDSMQWLKINSLLIWIIWETHTHTHTHKKCGIPSSHERTLWQYPDFFFFFFFFFFHLQNKPLWRTSGSSTIYKASQSLLLSKAVSGHSSSMGKNQKIADLVSVYVCISKSSGLLWFWTRAPLTFFLFWQIWFFKSLK